MRKVKILLIILAMLLFIFNYQICEYFYPTDLNKWWDLKVNNYAIIIALVFLSHTIDSNKWLRFFASLGVGFTISNVIDKVFFNVNTFNESDITMILITFAFSFIGLYKEIYGNGTNK
tara:strand:+ start:104 stop:457 length:354 start_codon:yes stop_codon:yes gene_type:complete